MIFPTLKRERELWGRGILGVAGVDEVGRGAWAGPVVAAAVRVKSEKSRVKSGVKNQKLFKRIRDSKLITWKERQQLYEFLVEADWIELAVGMAGVEEILRVGLGEANRLVMRRAVEGLGGGVDFLLIDAVKLPEYKENSESIIRGDREVFSIACASIIAKVTRDGMMRELAQKFPYWGFDKHKGYGTEFHRAMIERYGICEAHRKSFEPVRRVVGYT